MQGNRRRDTRPEAALSSRLHALGLRYRRDYPVVASGVRVRPDFAFTRANVAVFVDGCFWHGCPEHGNAPRANSDYWRAKLARNCARDERVTAALEAGGWTVVRVWEHEAVDDAAERVAHAVYLRA
ncbi:MAG: very short patch repair endonuclease [Actinomycetota bacterium]